MCDSFWTNQVFEKFKKFDWLMDLPDFLQVEPIEEDKPVLSRAFISMLAQFALNFEGNSTVRDCNEELLFEKALLQSIIDFGYCSFSAKMRQNYDHVIQKYVEGNSGRYSLLEIGSNSKEYVLLQLFCFYGQWDRFTSKLVKIDDFDKKYILKDRISITPYFVQSVNVLLILSPKEIRLIFSWFDKICSPQIGAECFQQFQYTDRMKDIENFTKIHSWIKYFDGFAPIKTMFLLFLFGDMRYIVSYIGCCDSVLGDKYLDEALSCLLLFRQFFTKEQNDLLVKRLERNIAQVFFYEMKY
jgi:hypothetical protein